MFCVHLERSRAVYGVRDFYNHRAIIGVTMESAILFITKWAYDNFETTYIKTTIKVLFFNAVEPLYCGYAL